jgi:hypothetical protein
MERDGLTVRNVSADDADYAMYPKDSDDSKASVQRSDIDLRNIVSW